MAVMEAHGARVDRVAMKRAGEGRLGLGQRTTAGGQQEQGEKAK